jgi:hypothetical protein
LRKNEGEIMATSTPWGVAQQSQRIAVGIVQYSTAGHGGIHLTAKRVSQMHHSIQCHIKASLSSSGGAWFEEDCEWALVALAFPEHFPGEEISAENTVRNWFPDVWESFYGKTLQPGQSYVRDKKLFYQKHADDQIVTAAWGSWAEHVPVGMVGVCAVKGGRQSVTTRQPETWWLVDAEEYNANRKFGFVIDPERHQQLTTPLGAHKKTAA